jgi:hypothetical protein
MLQVEGKKISKLVEVKSYRTTFFKNYCPLVYDGSIDKVIPINSDIGEILDDFQTNVDKIKFYHDTISLSEEDYVSNYTNLQTELYFNRRRIFIEEGGDKIAIKVQHYTSNRSVGKRHFRVRKNTYFITFNFKTKIFYVGSFSTKKKKIIGRTLKINPTYDAIQSFRRSIFIDEHIRYDAYFYEFFDKIWERLGIKNPQNFYCGDYRQLYTITTYLLSDVKIPNNWLKFGGTFFSKKELRKVNMNIVDAMMCKLKLKGSKVKKIFNEFEWVNFDKMYMLYHILGIDRFNKLPDNIFDEDYRYDECEKPMENNRCGRFWNTTYVERQNDLTSITPHLTNKEKDRILVISKFLDDSIFDMLMEHLSFKKELLKLGEDVKLKFNTKEELVEEHEEFSRIIQSYRKGEVERFYGNVINDLEKPIIHEGETYYPVVLRKTYDYEKESQHQRNCVRTYAERPDCIILSIRKGSQDGDERITVEYQYRANELINVQERARFNETPSQTFSHVARIELVNLNLLYKLGSLKLPKMVKTFRNGRTVNQQSVFEEIGLGSDTSRGRIIRITPMWDVNTVELHDNYWFDEVPVPVPVNYINPVTYINDVLP